MFWILFMAKTIFQRRYIWVSFRRDVILCCPPDKNPYKFLSSLIIAKKGKCLETRKHQRNKQRGSYLCWKVFGLSHLLFYAHWICMNYIIVMPLLVSSINTHNHKWRYSFIILFRLYRCRQWQTRRFSNGTKRFVFLRAQYMLNL